MADLLATIAADAPYSGQPDRALVTMRNGFCGCLGGPDPCAKVPTWCEACSAEWQRCGNIAQPINNLTGDYACPRCVGRGICTLCRRTSCSCVTRVRTGYHGNGRSVVARVAALAPPAVDPFLGCEIEAVWPLRHGQVGIDRDLGPALHPLRSMILAVEADSSLGDDGAEVITVPLPLSVVRETVPHILAAIASSGGSCATRACGAHIHVTANATTLRGACRVMATYGEATQLAVWDEVCGRNTRAYSSIMPFGPTHGLIPGTALLDQCPVGRYALGRSSNQATIEWRHPGGTDDPRVWIGRCELIVDVLNHAASMSSGRWGWGVYLRDRPAPTPETRYAFALLKSVGF